MQCSHPYIKKLGPGKLLCLECGEVIEKQIKVYDTSVLQMPPVIYGITEALWNQIKPWPLMPFALVKKYGWYVSFLYGRQYLIMPVFRNKKPVFYSARCLEKCEKRFKYSYPENREKAPWKSPKKGRSKYVLVGEGLADAAYMSQLATARALLGSYGELPEHVIIIMDGDIKGIEAAFRIVQTMRKQGIVDALTVMLPPGKDPTDMPLAELRKIIYEQTTVKL